MNGREHFVEAERLLEVIRDELRTADPLNAPSARWQQTIFARAQVHATLALAARHMTGWNNVDPGEGTP